VELLLELYLEWKKHPYDLHPEEGTHKFEDPVSKITLKVCSGVPIETGP